MLTPGVKNPIIFLILMPVKIRARFNHKRRSIQMRTKRFGFMNNA